MRCHGERHPSSQPSPLASNNSTVVFSGGRISIAKLSGSLTASRQLRIPACRHEPGYQRRPLALCRLHIQQRKSPCSLVIPSTVKVKPAASIAFLSSAVRASHAIFLCWKAACRSALSHSCGSISPSNRTGVASRFSAAPNARPKSTFFFSSDSIMSCCWLIWSSCD